MRKLKTILVASVLASSVFAAAGTAWAASAASFERGTSWTSLEDWNAWDDPGGISWEMFAL